MQLLIGVVAAVAIWQLLTRTRINTWAILIGVVAFHGVVTVVVGGPASSLEILVALGAMFVSFTVASAIRTVESVGTDLDDLRTDPAMLRADGVRLAEHLTSLGFEATPEGWLHLDGRGWDSLTLRRGVVNVLMVSGDHGPQMELTTFFDDGRVLTTVQSARDHVADHVLRQCFVDADVEVRVTEHERSIDWVTGTSRSALEIPLADLTDHMLSAERDHIGQLRSGIVGSMMRELRQQHLDLGSVINRADVVDSLRPT